MKCMIYMLLELVLVLRRNVVICMWLGFSDCISGGIFDVTIVLKWSMVARWWSAGCDGNEEVSRI